MPSVMQASSTFAPEARVTGTAGTGRGEPRSTGRSTPAASAKAGMASVACGPSTVLPNVVTRATGVSSSLASARATAMASSTSARPSRHPALSPSPKSVTNTIGRPRAAPAAPLPGAATEVDVPVAPSGSSEQATDPTASAKDTTTTPRRRIGPP